MKIEAGKFYKTRGGVRARVYAVDGEERRPIHGATNEHGHWDQRSWREGGRFSESFQSESYLDITSEWIDRPEMDWSALPRWAKWIAMDENGCWWHYPEKPDMEACRWGPANYSGPTWHCAIPGQYAPKWSGDWKDSLTEVPRKD